MAAQTVPVVIYCY